MVSAAAGGTVSIKRSKATKNNMYRKKEAFQMYVDYNGNICIEGVPAARFQVFHKRSSEQKASFSVIKYDIRTGKRLEGAVFSCAKIMFPLQPAHQMQRVLCNLWTVRRRLSTKMNYVRRKDI